MLEKNGLRVEKIVGKGITMSLRIALGVYSRTAYLDNLLDMGLQIELALCEKHDALGLAGNCS